REGHHRHVHRGPECRRAHIACRIQSNRRFACGSRREQHIAVSEHVSELAAAFFGEVARLAIMLEAARQTILDAPVSNLLADFLPMVLDLPGEIARELETRNPAVRVLDMLELRWQRYIND